jgi:hypothetical protein
LAKILSPATLVCRRQILRIWIFCPCDEGLSAELILRPVSPRASTLSVEVCLQPVMKSMGQVNLFQSIVYAYGMSVLGAKGLPLAIVVVHES